MIDINIDELHEKLNNKEEVIVIDVREVHEYEEYNIGAKNIPLGTLPNVMEDLVEDYKDHEVVVHCRSGGRSGVAKELLIKAGIPKTRNLLGGMLAWQEKYG